jgi:hypothetical protein
MHSTSPTLETYRAQTWHLEQSEGAKQSKDGRTSKIRGSAELVRPNRTFGAPLIMFVYRGAREFTFDDDDTHFWGGGRQGFGVEVGCHRLRLRAPCRLRLRDSISSLASFPPFHKNSFHKMLCQFKERPVGNIRLHDSSDAIHFPFATVEDPPRPVARMFSNQTCAAALLLRILYAQKV